MDIKQKALAVFAGMMVCGAAWSADGELGNTSQDSLAIDLKVPDFSTGGDGGAVLIQGLDDIDFGSFSSDGFVAGKGSNFCIYATGVGAGNTFDIDLTISGQSDNSDAGFVLSGAGDTANKISYQVYYGAGLDVNDGNGDEATHAATDHTFSDVQSVALNDSLDCIAATESGQADNASLYIAVKKTEISKAKADTYGGTLTLVAAAK